MPYGDRTGPVGLGPRGARRGRCRWTETPGGRGKGGIGRSWGRFCRRPYHTDAAGGADDTAKQAGQLTEMEDVLASLKAHLTTLSKK